MSSRARLTGTRSILASGPALLVVLLALLLATACGGGGGGGPEPGSDPWIDAEADAIAQRAARDLRDALERIDPCAPTRQQIADVYDALGRLQATGRDTPAAERAVAEGIAPAARAIARAGARGEDTGYTGPAAEALARAAGIDTLQPGWMDDPRCREGWTAVVEMTSVSAIPGLAASRVVTASVPLTEDGNGAVTGTADAKVVASMQPVPPCTFAFRDATTPLTVRGKRAGDVLELTLAHAAVTSPGDSVCELPTGTMRTPTPIPWPALADLHVSIPAQIGATATDASGTVKVTLLPGK